MPLTPIIWPGICGSSNAEAVDQPYFWVNHEFTSGGIVYARLAESKYISGQVCRSGISRKRAESLI